MVKSTDFRVKGLGVKGSGFRAYGLGFRVYLGIGV
jgi:hypothetical protein